MTLQQFLKLTATVEAAVLRRAMTAALATEPARTPDAYERFYHRVLNEVARETGTAGQGTSPMDATELVA